MPFDMARRDPALSCRNPHADVFNKEGPAPSHHVGNRPGVTRKVDLVKDSLNLILYISMSIHVFNSFFENKTCYLHCRRCFWHGSSSPSKPRCARSPPDKSDSRNSHFRHVLDMQTSRVWPAGSQPTEEPKFARSRFSLEVTQYSGTTEE
jgi:hypothetical protein